MIYGHDQEIKRLKELFDNNKLSHTIILQGEKGLGKSLIAITLSKYIFSHKNNKTDNMLDKDENVANRMEKGSYADFLLIKKGLNDKGKLTKDISINQIRKFNDFIKKKPIEGKYKVIIIDSIDDLNKSSSNAILKSVEEPPKNTIIILINHSTAKILPTIKSRAQSFNINKIDDDKIKQLLENKFNTINEKDLKTVLDLSDGNPGFAVKIMTLNGIEIYEDLCRKINKKDFSIIEQYSSKEISDDEYELLRTFILKIQQKSIKTRTNPQEIISAIENYKEIEKSIINETLFSMDKKQSLNKYITKLF